MAYKYMKGFGGKSANMILFGCDFNHSVALPKLFYSQPVSCKAERKINQKCIH